MDWGAPAVEVDWGAPVVAEPKDELVLSWDDEDGDKEWVFLQYYISSVIGYFIFRLAALAEIW